MERFHNQATGEMCERICYLCRRVAAAAAASSTPTSSQPQLGQRGPQATSSLGARKTRIDSSNLLTRKRKMSRDLSGRSGIICSCIAFMGLIWLSTLPLASIHCEAVVDAPKPAKGEPRRAVASRGSEAPVVPPPGSPKASISKVRSGRERRSPAGPVAPSMLAASLLMPINELRVSGSKSEPPSRPSVDWSKQRPYFGDDMARDVSVELGKTAYLTCKVFELGDKTVSWLRPRENEILTAGRYTYIGDPRFASINDQGSHDWILEIKDVGLNDSTGYECQVSTDPKMSVIVNLHVKAAKARIKQGEQVYAPLGANIEFTCEIGQKFAPSNYVFSTPPGGVQQTYWYFNGNLLNYARTHAVGKNFSIDWEPLTQTSRFKLFNVQPSDAGNYTCKPTSCEPTSIRLLVKKFNKSGQQAKDRAHYSTTAGHHSVSIKEAQRNRQHYGLDANGNGLELSDSSVTSSTRFIGSWAFVLARCLPTILLLTSHLILNR